MRFEPLELDAAAVSDRIERASCPGGIDTRRGFE
jgi:hypothetical protein